MNRIAYCGLDCEECPVLVATRTNDDRLREKTARDWEKNYAEYIGKDHLESSEMNCEGCRSESLRFAGCAHCPIRACAVAKSFEGCWACDSYEACGMIQGFHSHSQAARENTVRMRRC